MEGTRFWPLRRTFVAVKNCCFPVLPLLIWQMSRQPDTALSVGGATVNVKYLPINTVAYSSAAYAVSLTHTLLRSLQMCLTYKVTGREVHTLLTHTQRTLKQHRADLPRQEAVEQYWRTRTTDKISEGFKACSRSRDTWAERVTPPSAGWQMAGEDYCPTLDKQR